MLENKNNTKSLLGTYSFHYHLCSAELAACMCMHAQMFYVGNRRIENVDQGRGRN